MYKDTPIIFELATKSKASRYIRPLDVPKPDFSSWFGKAYRAEEPNIPDVDEISVVRHYTNLSNKNYHVEIGTYPLGSCTMKYNPKVNEDLAALPGFAATHPLQPDQTVQGNLELLYHLEQLLNDVTGMDAYTFQPAAGAQGERKCARGKSPPVALPSRRCCARSRQRHPHAPRRFLRWPEPRLQ